MANISDVYDIKFRASTPTLLESLFEYLEGVNKINPYYDVLVEPEMDGDKIIGHGASGRWEYVTNLEGAFTTPEQWFGDDDWKILEPAYKKIEAELKKGETVDVDWAEDEPGCELFQTGAGQLSFGDSIDFGYDTEGKDMPETMCPSCYSFMEEIDGEYTCEECEGEEE